jgi:hypothetical protein
MMALRMLPWVTDRNHVAAVVPASKNPQAGGDSPLIALHVGDSEGKVVAD